MLYFKSKIQKSKKNWKPNGILKFLKLSRLCLFMGLFNKRYQAQHLRFLSAPSVEQVDILKTNSMLKSFFVQL